MARSGRTYVRDSRGRFASTGGSKSGSKSSKGGSKSRAKFGDGKKVSRKDAALVSAGMKKKRSTTPGTRIKTILKKARTWLRKTTKGVYGGGGYSKKPRAANTKPIPGRAASEKGMKLAKSGYKKAVAAKGGGGSKSGGSKSRADRAEKKVARDFDRLMAGGAKKAKPNRKATELASAGIRKKTTRFDSPKSAKSSKTEKGMRVAAKKAAATRKANAEAKRLSQRFVSDRTAKKRSPEGKKVSLSSKAKTLLRGTSRNPSTSGQFLKAALRKPSVKNLSHESQRRWKGGAVAKRQWKKAVNRTHKAYETIGRTKGAYEQKQRRDKRFPATFGTGKRTSRKDAALVENRMWGGKTPKSSGAKSSASVMKSRGVRKKISSSDIRRNNAMARVTSGKSGAKAPKVATAKAKTAKLRAKAESARMAKATAGMKAAELRAKRSAAAKKGAAKAAETRKKDKAYAAAKDKEAALKEKRSLAGKKAAATRKANEANDPYAATKRSAAAYKARNTRRDRAEARKPSGRSLREVMDSAMGKLENFKKQNSSAKLRGTKKKK